MLLWVQLAEILAQLEDERAKTREVQSQLNLAMDLNTELKVSASLLAEEFAESERQRVTGLRKQACLSGTSCLYISRFSIWHKQKCTGCSGNQNGKSLRRLG